MSKQIFIVGGGISGLSILHQLCKKFEGRKEIKIRLIEKNDEAGGTVSSIRNDGYIFETGPNGFLDSKPSTLNLAREIGLGSELVPASNHTKTRYIFTGGRLHALPMGPMSFLKFQPLNLLDKIRILGEFFVSPGQNDEETVYEFGQRRLGENFAKYFLDPMVSGVFGGNAAELNLKAAFPRISEIEHKYGSLLKGMIRLGWEKRKLRKKNSLGTGQPTGQLWSLKKGMRQLTDTLQQRYYSQIQTREEVFKIEPSGRGYVIETDRIKYFADEVILTTPAATASRILADFQGGLSETLKSIPYASLAVVGLGYPVSAISRPPDGFGYLIPSHEKQEVLGVLFSSNIFPNRAPEGHVLFQVMIGGARYPGAHAYDDAELVNLAKEQIRRTLGPSQEPQKTFIVRWKEAIPQYPRKYLHIRSRISETLDGFPRFHLLSNYLDGISMNDCTANAEALAKRIEY